MNQKQVADNLNKNRLISGRPNANIHMQNYSNTSAKNNYGKKGDGFEGLAIGGRNAFNNQ